MNKENLKKLLLSLTEADYPEKADFHIHSNKSDGAAYPSEIVLSAEKSGKYIAIADHNTIEAYLSSNILSKDCVIPSAEFDCFYRGNIIHIMGLGIDIDSKALKSILAKTRAGRKCKIYRVLRLRSPKNVIHRIKEAGGIPILAHPARYLCFNLEAFIKPLIDFGLEGIEIYYPYCGLKNIIKYHSIEKIKEIADKYSLIKTGGSDFHGKIGTYIFD